jgi:predicted lipoprotein with Yx(FWY)xxD motif
MQSVAITVKSGHLVGPDGRTLYYNTVDTPTKIQCTGTCASIWPPVLGTPHPGPGLTAANFTTATRPDGGSQVVYQNHPLYEFGADKAGGMSGAGMTDGGGKWIVAMVGQAAGGGTSPSDTMSTGAGGGYGGY